jgi:hypothetical protein
MVGKHIKIIYNVTTICTAAHIEAVGSAAQPAARQHGLHRLLSECCSAQMPSTCRGVRAWADTTVGRRATLAAYSPLYEPCNSLCVLANILTCCSAVRCSQQHSCIRALSREGEQSASGCMQALASKVSAPTCTTLPHLQKQMEGIEEQVGSLLRAVEGSEEEARRLRGVVAGMQVAAEAQQLEARTAREELKRVRKEALRATDQLDALRRAHHQLQVRRSLGPRAPRSPQRSTLASPVMYPGFE